MEVLLGFNHIFLRKNVLLDNVIIITVVSKHRVSEVIERTVA